MATRLNTPPLAVPQKLLDDPDRQVGAYFEQISFFLLQLNNRTGGASVPVNGQVDSVVGGNDINVDSTDGANPIVNFDGTVFGDASSPINNFQFQKEYLSSTISDDYVTIGNEKLFLSEYVTVSLNEFPQKDESVWVKSIYKGGWKVKGNGKLIDDEEEWETNNTKYPGLWFDYDIDKNQWARR